MFTDNPTIPTQLEVLIEVLHLMRDKNSDIDTLKKLIQPKGLPDSTETSKQLRSHINAANELGLIELNPNKHYKLTFELEKNLEAKQFILKAFDEKVLADTHIEKWAARFYSYLIVQDKDIGPIGESEQELFSKEFMEMLPVSIGKENPMNHTKYKALIRWYCYCGMGWIDPEGRFVPDPSERILRSLTKIFGVDKKLSVDVFMSKLAQNCPELDGGFIFNEVTGPYYKYAEKLCTRALATALWRLHDEKELRLHCPNDTMGWQLALAGEGLVSGEASNRISSLEKLDGGRHE